LIKAHITPKGFARLIRGVEEPLLRVSADGVGQAHPLLGEYDQNILCAECDGILGKNDDYAVRVCREFKAVLGDLFEDKAVDAERFSKFVLSMLWRASISTRGRYFGVVTFGPYQPVTKEVIFGGSSIDKIPAFKLILSRLHSDKHDVSKIITDPIRFKFERLNSYIFFLAGFRVLAVLDGRNLPSHFDALIINRTKVGGGLIKLAESTTSFATPALKVDPSLVAEALVKTGDELLEVKTVGQVIKWGIDVEGLSNIVPRTKDDVATACRNALAQANHFWGWPFLYETKMVDYVAFLDEATTPTLKAQVVLESIASGACSIEINYNVDRSNVDSIVVEANMSNAESIGKTWIKDVRLPQSVGLPSFGIRMPSTLLSSLVGASGPPFDPRTLTNIGKPDWCASTQSKSKDEKAVCDDAQLSAYDVVLDSYYHQVSNKASVADRANLRQAQQQWLAQRRTCGSDKDCLNSVYLSRIGKIREQL
jgi:hypothetical protein